MKLFVAATALVSVSAWQRAFANQPTFIAGTDDWWSPAAAVKQFGDLETETEKYFATYFDTTSQGTKAGNQMAKHLQKTRDDMQKLNDRCGATSSRGRRGADNGERLTLATNDPKSALFTLFWAYARWARNEIQPTCPKAAMRMFKKIDRLQQITAWAYCAKVSDSSPFCSWALYNSNDTRKKNPRKQPWFLETYGNDIVTPFRATVCEHAQHGPATVDLSCPAGTVVTVSTAEYGRWNSQECRGSTNGISGKCPNKVDIIDYATAKCGGQEACTLEANNSINGEVVDRQDPCRGVAKYARFWYTCTVPPPSPDAGFAIACEHSSQFGEYTITMDCPTGKVINVDEAEYGRWSGDTCPAQKGVTYTRECDKYVDIMDHATSTCNGKANCDYRGNNSVQGQVYDLRAGHHALCWAERAICA